MNNAARPRSQRGAVVAAFMALVAGMALTLLLTHLNSKTLAITQSQANAAPTDLANAQRALSQWYKANHTGVDTSLSQPSQGTLKANSDPQALHGLRVQSSDVLGLPCADTTSSTCIAYRKFALWIPANNTPDTAVWNPATGVFIPGNARHWTVLDGARLVRENMVSTMASMNDIAQRLQLYYAQRLQSSGLVSSTRSYFHAQVCTAVALNEIACYVSPTPGASTNAFAAAQIDTRLWATPLGAIHLTNFSNTETAPFTATLTLTTPWASTLTVIATQPL